MSSLRLATANGPDPMGWRPNDRSASWSTGTSARMWAGAIGWVAAWRNPPSGVFKVKTTVRVPAVATVTSFHEPAPGRCSSGPGGRPMVNATSSAVTGSPSCQRASSRSWKVQTAPVASTDQRSARSGTSVPDGPLRTSPE